MDRGYRGRVREPLADRPEAFALAGNGQRADEPPTKVYPFGVSRERLEQEARHANADVAVTSSLEDADLILTTKSHFRQRAGLIQTAEELGKPVFVLRRNTPDQIRTFVMRSAGDEAEEASGPGAGAGVDRATQEAQEGVTRILKGEADHVELNPQSSFIRRVQHRIAEQANLRSRSIGRDPQRRVTIHRG
ncbi:MAG: hypothetical protein FJ318_08040 [SAR202 cluster bacterium]|nr:hypothetical protein [SAR202 cluster bacterium]